jgi:hypothetical protein
MITKTILGVTAAAFIAAGSLGATASSAAASGVYVGGNGFYFGFNDGYGPHGKKICKPIYKKVGWKDKWGHWHTKVKLVDYKCYWKPYGNWHGGYGHW